MVKLEQRVTVSSGKLEDGRQVVWFRIEGERGAMGYTDHKKAKKVVGDYRARGFKLEFNSGYTDRGK